MSTSVQERKPHSAEYFGEYRDFWWNSDFLKLMANRLQLDQAKTVLDVGCGIGHWGQILAPVLPKDVRHVNILMTQIETIQTAVRIFLKLRKVSGVVLVTVIIETAEDACAQIVV